MMIKESMRITPIEKNMIMAYRKAGTFDKELVHRFFNSALCQNINNESTLNYERTLKKSNIRIIK